MNYKGIQPPEGFKPNSWFKTEQLSLWQNLISAVLHVLTV